LPNAARASALVRNVACGRFAEFWRTDDGDAAVFEEFVLTNFAGDEHPSAGPEQLRDATVQITKNIWNQCYAPILGKTDVVLLAVYSHMIDSFMYLPDYSIGHLIAFSGGNNK
jgi:hypothetical protein